MSERRAVTKAKALAYVRAHLEPQVGRRDRLGELSAGPALRALADERAAFELLS